MPSIVVRACLLVKVPTAPATRSAEYLASLSGGGAEFTRLEEQQRRIQRQIKQFRAGDRLGRAELHDRALR